MIILIDMDEVLADFEGHLLEIWTERFPDEPLFPPEGRTRFYIGANEHSNKSERVSSIINEVGFFQSLQPVKGSKQAVSEIQELGHSVFFLTSPGVSYPNAASDKYRWVEQHFGKYMLERLIITPAKRIVRGDILIDDRPEIYHESVALWEHVLFDRPYNQSITNKRRLSWENWKEVLTELL